MTQILFDLKETSPNGDVPIDAQINCYPVARRKDGTVLVTRRGFTVRTGFKPVVIDLHQTSLDGAWLITISSHNNDIVHGFYAGPAPNMVDGAEVATPFNDLIMVDPDTLEPSEEPDPIWWAMARSTVTGGSVDGSGDLILTHYDGKTTNAGRVKGDRGERGERGLQGDKGDKGDTGEGLIVTGIVPTATDLPATANEGDGILTEDDNHLHVWIGDAFVDVGRIKGDKGDKGDTGEVSNADLELQLGVIRGKSLGVVGDGVTDDTLALSNAMIYASQRGVKLSLSGLEVVKISGVVSVPENTNFDGGGCIISVPAVYGSVAFTVQGDNVSMKNFKIITDTAVSNNTRGIAATDRKNITFENVYVESNIPGAGSGNLNRTAITLTRCENVRLENFNVKNYEYPTEFSGCSRIYYNGGVIDTFIRGLYMTEIKDSQFSNVVLQGLSPNSNVQPGHNGVLIGTITPFGTDNLRFENVIVKNSGEHGFRIGAFIPVSNVIFDKCISINAGASGFKVLGGQTGGTEYHEDISCVDCTVIDAGNIENMTAGFMFQFVRRGRVINPTVIRRNKTYSAAYGVEFQAIQGLFISNPFIRDTQNAGIKMGHVLGDITDVIIDGGSVTNSSGHSIWFTFTNRTLRRVKIVGHPTLTPSGDGYAIYLESGGSGTSSGGCIISWYSTQPSALQVSPLSSTVSFVADALCSFDPALHGSLFRNGSLWRDHNLTTGAVYHRVGSAWKTPLYA